MSPYARLQHETTAKRNAIITKMTFAVVLLAKKEMMHYSGTGHEMVCVDTKARRAAGVVYTL